MLATIPLKDWLLIEFYSFYAYMASAIIFITRHQIKGWIWPVLYTDIKKQLTDFIIYEDRSLTWFAFNLVCCLMPPIMGGLVVSNANMPDLKRFELTTSEWAMIGLMGIQWIGHLLQTWLNADLHTYEDTSIRNEVEAPEEGGKERYYRLMTRRFRKASHWIWYLQGTICIGTFTAYMFVKGDRPLLD